MSAYILILPGLGLKVACDLLMYFSLGVKANWLKAKMLMMAFLGINTFVFLVPLMPELLSLARDSLPSGEVSQAFLYKAATEQLVGMSKSAGYFSSRSIPRGGFLIFHKKACELI